MEISRTQVSRAAYVAAGVNLAAALAMLLILQPGLPVEGSVPAARIAYVTGNLGLWWGGWALWHAAAITLLGLYVGLAGLWFRRAPILCGLALLIGAAGLAADLGAEAIYMGVAPRLGPEAYLVGEAVAGVFTGYLGNTLYTVAGILLTWAGRADLPRPLLALGAAVWAAGLWLSGASLVHSAFGQFWSTAIMMPLFVLWTALVGRWLEGRGA